MIVPRDIPVCPVRHACQDFIACVLSQVVALLERLWALVFHVSVMDTAACVTLERPYARIANITLLVTSVNDVLLDTTELSKDCQMTVSNVLVL